MEYCDDDRAYIRAKTDSFSVEPQIAAEPMTTPITRQQLQGLRKVHLLERLTEIINEETREFVLDSAREGRTSYLWDVHQTWLERKLDERGWATTRFTLDDLVEAVKALYPGCTVTLIREDVLIPQREAAPKRDVQAGLQIDWS